MICLQGGGEFSPACREMDAVLIEGLTGPVVVTALAGAPGPEYARATANGARHFRALGAAEVVQAPDPRSHPEAVGLLRAAALLVLPGGSPRRLLSGLQDTGADQAVRDVLARGGRVMGASAGAMVLGPWTVLPEDGVTAVPGLGVSPVAVVPHWNRGPRPDWEAALAGRAPVVGLAEEAGVLVRGLELTAVGTAPASLVTAGRDLPVGETAALG